MENIMDEFQFADASIIGKMHKQMYYNNQDACCIFKDEKMFIGVICDGSGSGSNSEVGSQLASRFIVNVCKSEFKHKGFDENILKKKLLAFLTYITDQTACENERKEFIGKYLAFTIVGFLVKKEKTTLFSMGDGLIIINDNIHKIDQGNKPDYLAKELITGEKMQFSIIEIETRKIEKLLIGCDGVLDLLEKENEILPNGETTLNIQEYFNVDRFFEDPVALPKYLSLLESTNSILYDDTTIIMLRRNKRQG